MFWNHLKFYGYRKPAIFHNRVAISPSNKKLIKLTNSTSFIREKERVTSMLYWIQQNIRKIYNEIQIEIQRTYLFHDVTNIVRENHPYEQARATSILSSSSENNSEKYCILIANKTQLISMNDPSWVRKWV